MLCEALLTAGYVLCEHGDYEPAERLLQEALQIWKKLIFHCPDFVLCTLGITTRGRQMYEQASVYLTKIGERASLLDVPTAVSFFSYLFLTAA
jgi:hypothetical protein